MGRKGFKKSERIKMAFIEEAFLKEKITDPELKKFAEKYIVVESWQPSQITIFLCHSHKDKEIAEGFQNLIAQYGVHVYIDWQDSTLPDTPNKETAGRIKDKIKTLSLFILLATNNALLSRWCPWEIGIADTVKDYDSILIVPVIDSFGEFTGNEYLQLYKRIEISLGAELFIMEPEFRKYGDLFLFSFEIKDPNKSLKSFIEAKAKR
jgi:hypothetical protein